MRLLSFAVFAFASHSVWADCSGLEVEIPLGALTSMSFVGYAPSVERFSGEGMGNKVVFKNFERTPIVSDEGGVLEVSVGMSCDPDAPDNSFKTNAPSAGNSVGHALAFAIPVALSATGVPAFAAAALGLASLGAIGKIPFAEAQVGVEACNLVPIEVEIYVDATVNSLVMQGAQSGDFEACPPESLYWKHHPDVFGGYEGCVGEKGYYPCPQDSQGVWEEEGLLAAKYPIVWDGTSCVNTGYSVENRTYWVLWGDPLDKYELNKRTGFNPVVSFPFNRGPYPKYEQGVAVDLAIDDSSDARAMAKDLLVYIGAFTAAELVDWEVTMTEGAESGMTAIWAGKALEIARTTCNRDIYALMEVPAYGYSPSDAAAMVNSEADSFYNSAECSCFNTTSCNDPVVSISNRGWFPSTPFPVEMGGDGMMYAADSESSSSPWMESLVFPENPSGVIKTTQLADSNRRVCDGVYLWPMYFGMRDYEIPMDERPDCSAWSFSITKAYSATVRAGFIMYKKEPETSFTAMVDIQRKLYSMTHGLYSEWSWYGQMQIWEMIMSRPLDDPTSWIGAYTEIMDEKWELMIDAFAGCPVLTLTNPKAGAYAWFKYEAPYIGIQGGFVSSFFRDVLGVRTTTYNWGFRGADPADFYGVGYGLQDFTRLQLYRDISVYTEIARRAKIVCADTTAVIGDFISIDQWAAGEGTTSRRMNEGYDNLEERKDHLMEAIPDLNERQLEYLAKSHKESDTIDEKARGCAPNFTTDCLFRMVGSSFQDY